MEKTYNRLIAVKISIEGLENRINLVQEYD
jgi:hypothetical protein